MKWVCVNAHFTIFTSVEVDRIDMTVRDPVYQVERQEDWRRQPHCPRVDVVAECLLVRAHEVTLEAERKRAQ